MAQKTKPEIVAELGALGVAHDPAAPKATLQALLDQHADPSGPVVVAPVAADPAPKVNSELQEAWEAFLATAEEQRKRDGTHEIFLAQKERGEFDKIPDTFVLPTNIKPK